MNIRQCAQSLLSHFAPEERAIPDAEAYPGRNSAVQEAMNAALQEMYALGGPWTRWEQRGGRLPAPRVVTLDGTPDSLVVRVTQDPGAALTPRSTIVFANSPADEENAQATRPSMVNGEQAIGLLFPPPAAGPLTATIYGDALEAGDDVMSIHDPVMVGGITVSARADLRDAQWISANDYGAHRERTLLTSARATIANTASRPVAYDVESLADDMSDSTSVIMRFFPAPARSMAVTYWAKLRPRAITTLTTTDPLPVPQEFVQTLFLPIARMKLVGSAFFRDAGRVDEIQRSYRDARDLAARATTQKSGMVFGLRH